MCCAPLPFQRPTHRASAPLFSTAIAVAPSSPPGLWRSSSKMVRKPGNSTWDGPCVQMQHGQRSCISAPPSCLAHFRMRKGLTRMRADMSKQRPDITPILFPASPSRAHVPFAHIVYNMTAAPSTRYVGLCDQCCPAQHHAGISWRIATWW